MRSAKVAITIDREILTKLDRLVERKIYPNRSKAIQEAVLDKLEKLDRNRLARECARLNPKFEQALAEEGMSQELNEWPEY
ncbi:MAG: ribbon-helix-helix domain-containing protein [Blastocatellia bacterium]